MAEASVGLFERKVLLGLFRLSMRDVSFRLRFFPSSALVSLFIQFASLPSALRLAQTDHFSTFVGHLSATFPPLPILNRPGLLFFWKLIQTVLPRSSFPVVNPIFYPPFLCFRGFATSPPISEVNYDSFPFPLPAEDLCSLCIFDFRLVFTPSRLPCSDRPAESVPPNYHSCPTVINVPRTPPPPPLPPHTLTPSQRR